MLASPYAHEQQQRKEGGTAMDDKFAQTFADMIAVKVLEIIKPSITALMTPKTPCYTVDEAADLMRVGRAQIMAWIRSGKLEAFFIDPRHGRKYLIKTTDLDTLMSRLKEESARRMI